MTWTLESLKTTYNLFDFSENIFKERKQRWRAAGGELGFSAPIQDVSCVTAWTVSSVAPVSIKHKALASKAITLLTSLTYHSTLAKKKKTCVVAAVITVGLGSEHSTLPDKGQGLCPDRAWCFSQGPAVAHSPPHGWHSLLSLRASCGQEKLFWSRSSTYCLCWDCWWYLHCSPPHFLVTSPNSTPMFLESELS